MLIENSPSSMFSPKKNVLLCSGRISAGISYLLSIRDSGKVSSVTPVHGEALTRPTVSPGPPHSAQPSPPILKCQSQRFQPTTSSI